MPFRAAEAPQGAASTHGPGKMTPLRSNMVTRNPDTFFNTVSPMKTTIFYAQQTLKTLKTLKRAMSYGTVMSSFSVEDFSVKAVSRLSKAEICRRYEKFVKTLAIK